MPAAAAAPMQGTYIPQYTAVPASAITVEVRGQKCILSPCSVAPWLIHVCGLNCSFKNVTTLEREQERKNCTEV